MGSKYVTYLIKLKFASKCHTCFKNCSIMYCFIQYIETIKNESEIEQFSESTEPEPTPKPSCTNIIETKKLMVNPNCPVPILLDYICSEIGIDKNSNYDLCDPESGELLGIKQNKPWTYATNILKSKQTYIVVFYEKDEHGHYNKLEPFLNRESRQYSEILTRLKRQLSTLRRKSSARFKRSKRGSSKGSTPDSFASYKELQKKRSSTSIIKNKS